MTLFCRSCNQPLDEQFLDLGYAPYSNAYLTPDSLVSPETTYPLRLFVCSSCFLVQTEDFAAREELFGADYAYFSSTSESWLAHARVFCEMATRRFALDSDSLVIEIASNDGYLLQYFVNKGIPSIGVEPTLSTAVAAEEKGIYVIRDFFGSILAEKLVNQGRCADLVVGNNVYAHVPDINDFTDGLSSILKPEGVVTLEFPHLMRIVEHCQFDTVYHEHFSYLSLTTVIKIFDSAGLRVFDVDELSTHGGSLRVYGCRTNASHITSEAVNKLIAREEEFGLTDLKSLSNFQKRANQIKDGLLQFLLNAKRDGKKVVGYGAAAKGNTILNYAGIKPDLLPIICDASVAKQGKVMPGSHIPIVSPVRLALEKPDYILILPWNIADEVSKQLTSLTEMDAKLLIAVPEVRFL